MQQMFRYGITAAFLLLCSWQDIKTKEISMRLMLLFAVTGIFLNILTWTPWQIWVGGILPGVGMLVFSKLSEEQIGYGDGIALFVTGLFLTGKETLGLFLTALFFCAFITVPMFFTGKLGKGASYPFLPFLAAAYSIYLFLRIPGH